MSSFRRGTAHAVATVTAREKLLLVPEDRQRNQDDRNDPQNDVFAAAFFFCHKSSTAYLKSRFKCRADFPCSRSGLRRPLIAGELHDLAQVDRFYLKVQRIIHSSVCREPVPVDHLAIAHEGWPHIHRLMLLYVNH